MPKTEDIYSDFHMEDITASDYSHAKNACKDFEIKNFGEYHDLYLKSERLLLAVLLEYFRKICLALYQLDPAKFHSAPGLG